MVITAFVEDAGKVSDVWASYCGANADGQSFKVVTIVRCGSSDSSLHPRPSGSVRPGSWSTVGEEYVTAGALADCLVVHLHEGGKHVMEMSRQVAAAGLQDAAADDMYENLSDQMEVCLGTAFDSGVGEWLRIGSSGARMDIEELSQLLAHCRSAIVDLMMLLGMWSLSRLEEKGEEVACTAQGIYTVVVAASGGQQSRRARSRISSLSAASTPRTPRRPRPPTSKRSPRASSKRRTMPMEKHFLVNSSSSPLKSEAKAKAMRARRCLG